MAPLVEAAVRAVVDFIDSAVSFAPEALEERRPWWVKSAGFASILAGLTVVLLLIWSALT